jgi:hypothetical protein
MQLGQNKWGTTSPGSRTRAGAAPLHEPPLQLWWMSAGLMVGLAAFPSPPRPQSRRTGHGHQVHANELRWKSPPCQRCSGGGAELLKQSGHEARGGGPHAAELGRSAP